MKKAVMMLVICAVAFATQQKNISDDIAIPNPGTKISADLFPEVHTLMEQMMEARVNRDMERYNQLLEEYKSLMQPVQETRLPDPIEITPAEDPIMRWGTDIIIYSGLVNYNSWAMLLDVDDEAISVDYHRGDTVRAAVACVDSVVRIFISLDNGINWAYERGFTWGTEAVYEPEIIHGPTGSYWHVIVRTSHGNGNIYGARFDDAGVLSGAWIESTDDTVTNYSVCSDRAEWPTGYYLYCAYHKSLGGPGLDGIWWTRSLDYGASWEAALQLQFSGSGHPDVTYGSGGTIFESYLARMSSGNKNINARVSTNYGSTWAGSQIVETDTLIKHGPQIAASHDGTDDAWVVWPRRWSSDPYDYDLWWAWTQDEGATWSTPGFLSSYFKHEVLPSITVYDTSGMYDPYISYIVTENDTEWTEPIIATRYWDTDSTWADPDTFNDYEPEFTRPIQTWQSVGIPALAYVGAGGQPVYFDAWSNTAVEEHEVAAPRNLLGQTRPNPFVDMTRFSYTVPVSGMVTIRAFNIAGQQVATLVQEHKSTGTYTATWNGKDNAGANLPKGVYFLKLEYNGIDASRKVILE
ncbi:MAG: T9SS type A sorting domain-containing protein [candidate division WOR-3 bacterium]|nr:MAG: T9SS type A sorting domain-containing protein [candidate division WOR-3 bacterium]